MPGIGMPGMPGVGACPMSTSVDSVCIARILTGVLSPDDMVILVCIATWSCIWSVCGMLAAGNLMSVEPFT